MIMSDTSVAPLRCNMRWNEQMKKNRRRRKRPKVPVGGREKANEKRREKRSILFKESKHGGPIVIQIWQAITRMQRSSFLYRE
jgi:hypothetical protein